MVFKVDSEKKIDVSGEKRWNVYKDRERTESVKNEKLGNCLIKNMSPNTQDSLDQAYKNKKKVIPLW